jgi:ubiquinone/menaquinone biosynthesis C-methylase UbiE
MIHKLINFDKDVSKKAQDFEEDFKKIQVENYQGLASRFDKKQKRENRNHINKIKAISNFLEIKKGDKVLEIGIGTGIHAKYLLENNKENFKFIGVDLSKEMLKQSKEKLKNFKNISLQVMDGAHLKFKDNTFDKVYISGSLHHYLDPETGIREIVRVLKKGGKFCIMEPNYIFPTNFYSANTIKEERNMKLMKEKNFIRWMSNKKIKYQMTNFAYTPPIPKSFIPIYDQIDKIIVNIPI